MGGEFFLLLVVVVVVVVSEHLLFSLAGVIWRTKLSGTTKERCEVMENCFGRAIPLECTLTWTLAHLVSVEMEKI
jgi:hypothetical protein